MSSIIVSSGQICNHDLVHSGERMHVEGTANNIIIESGGGMYVYNNATADNPTVHFGGFLHVSNGGYATNVVENGGYVYIVEYYAAATFASNTITGITLKHESMTVHENTIAENTIANAYGSMYVYSGGIANNTAINEGGLLRLYSSATANSTTVNSGGVLHVSKGGTDNNTTVNSDGILNVSSCGTANNTTVNESGAVFVSSCGAINGAVVNSRGALYISAGATGTQIIENGGYVEVEDGASVTFAPNTISGLKFDSDSDMTVHSNTTTQDLSTNRASIYVYNGGAMYNTCIDPYGDVHVSSGGMVDNAAVHHIGSLHIQSGGTATQVVESGGRVIVDDGAYVTFASSLIKDFSFSSGNVTIHSNTVASNTSVYCPVFVYSGGVMIDTDVKKSNVIVSGGVMSNSIVALAQYIELYSSAVHRGTIRTGDGGKVRVYESTCSVDFTVSERSVNDDYLIDNLANVYAYERNAKVTYTITVAADQIDGTYMLAQGAQSLDGALTLGDGSADYGSITVNGEILEYNGATYELDLSDSGDLTLTITGSNTADPSANLLCNGVSQIVACDSSQGKVGYTATDGKSSPAWSGVWEWSGADISQWSVAGVGRFQGSEVDYNGLLLYNKDSSRFAAWTDLKKDNYGYVELCQVDNSFETECLADLDGSEYDDILIHDDNGSIGVVLDGTSYKDIWHVEAGEFKTWTVEGAGSFGDGADKLVMVNNYNNQVYLWTNKDTTFSTWNWETESVGKLEDGWEIAAIGDFERDGIDDIMVLDRNTNNVWVWDNGNGDSARWRGTLGEGFKIEAVGDYNGDGKDDLLLREHLTGWGGLGYWGAGYAGSWVDLNAHIETDLDSKFTIIA